MKAFSRAVALAAAAMMLAGCASFNMIKPPPAQQQPIRISISGDGPSGWSDLPIGVYRVPNTNVIISGHQKGVGVGFLFGVVGILAADAANTGSGAKKVKDAEDALRIDLVPEATEMTKAMLATGRFGQAFSLDAAPGGPVLQVVPYPVISFASDTDARASVILKVTLGGGKGAPAWSTRYMAVEQKAVPLVGEGSLTENGGALLKATLHRDLERAVGAMLADVANHPARDDTKRVYAETAVPFMRMRWGLAGDEIADDGQTVVMTPKIGDLLVFAGVLVLDKSTTTIRPATPDEKNKIFDEGQ